jgi:pyruvate kinase
MKAVIERFEAKLAVIEYEDGTIHELYKDSLPKDCKEGDCLLIENGKILLDTKETSKRKAEINSLMDDLFEK